MKLKPRLYWMYYPLSRRGYWRVSPKPKVTLAYVSEAHHKWQAAHKMASQMNATVERRR